MKKRLVLLLDQTLLGQGLTQGLGLIMLSHSSRAAHYIFEILKCTFSNLQGWSRITCIANGLSKHGRPEVRHCLEISGSAHHAQSCNPSCHSEEGHFFSSASLRPMTTGSEWHSPWTWAICQWGMFTFLLFRGGKGKTTTSPPANTPSVFVCIICRKIKDSFTFVRPF